MSFLLNGPTIYFQNVQYENYAQAAQGLADQFEKSTNSNKARIECKLNGKDIHVTFNHDFPQGMGLMYAFRGSLRYKCPDQAPKSFYQIKLTVDEASKVEAEKLSPLLLSCLKANNQIPHDLIHIKTKSTLSKEKSPILPPSTTTTAVTTAKPVELPKASTSPAADNNPNNLPSLSFKSISMYPIPGSVYQNGFWVVQNK